MFVKNVYTFRNLPVEEGERRWTDCLCTIISAIFALTLFILACCTFNRCTNCVTQRITSTSTTRWSRLGRHVRVTSAMRCLFSSLTPKISRADSIG